MNWCFVDKHTVVEKHTGYMIVLISGSWIAPQEIKPVSPKGISFLKQAQLMREGLEFVAELCMMQSAKQA